MRREYRPSTSTKAEGEVVEESWQESRRPVAEKVAGEKNDTPGNRDDLRIFLPEKEEEEDRGSLLD